MTEPQRLELTDFEEPVSIDGGASSPVAKSLAEKLDPFVRPQHGFHVLVIGVTLAVFGVLYALAIPPWGALVLAIVGSLLGLALTLVSMAWGTAVAFTEGAWQGSWFALFPPYMAWYAARRWRWMAQPTTVFLCGVGLAAASLWVSMLLLQPPT